MTGRRFEWDVRASYQSDDGVMCVDIFERVDGSYGFEQFRRDPEDSGPWTRVSNFAELTYRDLDKTLSAARRQLRWLEELMMRSE